MTSISSATKILFALEILASELPNYSPMAAPDSEMLLKQLSDLGDSAANCGLNSYKVWDAIAEVIKNPRMPEDWS